MKMFIKKLHPNAIVPTFAHHNDAGMDICTIETITVPAGKRMIANTGIAVEIPPQTVCLVCDKSGLAVKHGITILAGVIDEGYRGEIKVVLFNSSDSDYTFEAGHKIAQILTQPVLHPEVIETDELSDSTRGDGRFGSTGK